MVLLELVKKKKRGLIDLNFLLCSLPSQVAKSEHSQTEKTSVIQKLLLNFKPEIAHYIVTKKTS